MKSIVKLFSLLTLSSFLFFACDKDKSGVFYGDDVHFGNGHARAYAELDENGDVIEVGVSLDKAATEGLSNDPGDHHNSASLIFPEEAKASGYDHVLFDWAPFGHEPSGVYTLPHFDCHFYSQALSEREAIPAYEVDSTKYNILPAADYFPATYIRIPGGVPGMGVHWIDVTSPELNGQTFTHTFIYGSYDGVNTFYEPMITLAALQSATTPVEVAIKQPSKYAEGVMYAQQYTYQFDAGKNEYRIALNNFKQ